MTGPLDWLRVVDCTSGLAGGWTTALLADYGADVVWVEPPGGDPLREALAVPYAALHRSHRSAILDVTDPGDLDRLRGLLAGADVLVHGWTPAQAAGLGLDYPTMHAAHPGLVYTSITAFGADGPYPGLGGYDSIVHAVVGSMGEQDGHREPPIYVGQPFASLGAAFLADVGILAALYRRHSDQVGRHVETSLYDGALAFLMMTWGEADGDDKTPLAKRGTKRMIVRTFRCGDGEYLGVHTGAVGAYGRLMHALGLADRMSIDPHGRDMMYDLTPEERSILDTEIYDVFASKTRDEWAAILRSADVCAVEHFRPCEAFDTSQVQANDIVIRVEDPVLGPLEQVGPTIALRGIAPVRHTGAPRPGQHTDAVLAAAQAAGGTVATPAPDTRPLLDGVNILDLGAYYAGPYSSRLLADFGADVIKLETVRGDSLRGLSQVFRAAQAGKRSIAADLKDPALTSVATALARWADVVHHNMRPDAAERVGMGEEQVRAVKPDVVYQYAPGWGSSGPDRKRQSFAPMLSGFVGLTFEVAGAYNEPLPPIGNEDPGNGLLGAIAILLGLIHRQRTGNGLHVEAPQVNAAMSLVSHIMRRAPEKEVLGAGALDPLQLGISPTDRLYETTDGWIVIAAYLPEELRGLQAATGVLIVDDERFGTHALRRENEYVLADLLGSAFAGKPTADWLKVLADAGVPAAAPVPYNNHAFLTDPENLRTRRAVVTQHPQDGAVREIGLLVRISDTTFPEHRRAPELGEHSESILRWAGYSDEAVADAVDRDAVRQFIPR
ncbi:MAG TPA: CoA transferase [Mycobacteriales bacterium]|nr:CoA transferase [Mycobacteriales bacterium]